MRDGSAGLWHLQAVDVDSLLLDEVAGAGDVHHIALVFFDGERPVLGALGGHGEVRLGHAVNGPLELSRAIAGVCERDGDEQRVDLAFMRDGSAGNGYAVGWQRGLRNSVTVRLHPLASIPREHFH